MTIKNTSPCHDPPNEKTRGKGVASLTLLRLIPHGHL